MSTDDAIRKGEAKGRRKRLLIISQVYVPDSAAVGQCLADAAEEMVRRNWEVVVYTSARGYDNPSLVYPRRETHNGVQIRRLLFSSFGKKSIPVRLCAQVIFIAQAFVMGLLQGGIDAVLVSTSPPFAGFFGALIARLRKAALVWWVMDLNPDQMVAAGKIAASSTVARAFDWMNRITLRQASYVVVLDEYMRSRLAGKARLGERRMHVIPPWAHAEAAKPSQASPDAFRVAHGLQGKFVIMYSGNHALQHPLDTLLDAAAALEKDSRIVFVFVGGGAGKALVESRIERGATNVLSLPYQPLAELTTSLSAADLHVVSMGDNMVGIVHPCKIYGVMVVGRPVLYFGPAESHVGKLVAEHLLGWQVSHGDVAAAVAAVQEGVGMPTERLLDIGARGVAAAGQFFPRGRLIAAFCDVIEQSRASGPRQRH